MFLIHTSNIKTLNNPAGHPTTKKTQWDFPVPDLYDWVQWV